MPTPPVDAATALLGPSASPVAALEGSVGTGLPAIGESQSGGDDMEEMIDLDRVEGRVRASMVKKVGEIVDRHPEEALAILRSWLNEER
ncbi:MAG: flagellar M-ring protein FliF, partial [Rhodospirillales bacterium]|nr:flagellar M-ring protein FliF [Rhodospirillales bacterium]